MPRARLNSFDGDREQHLLAVRAHADDDEQRDGGGLPVEPDAHHRAVEDQPYAGLFLQRPGIPSVPVGLHLAPDPAHRVLADRAAEIARRARADNSARIDAGEVADSAMRARSRGLPVMRSLQRHRQINQHLRWGRRWAPTRR